MSKQNLLIDRSIASISYVVIEMKKLTTYLKVNAPLPLLSILMKKLTVATRIIQNSSNKFRSRLRKI